MKFYDCQRLLHTKDRNGETPELFMVSSRVRGPGKTFSFTKHLMAEYMAGHGKFVLLTRHMKDLGSIAEGMMKSMLSVHYPSRSVREVKQQQGTFSEIWLDTWTDGEKESEDVGYVIPLAAADKIKNISSMFSDANRAFFDEYMPQNGVYLKDEVAKFLNIHTSIARGAGQSRRYFPVYMASNTVDIANPYFIALGLTEKIQYDTKFYRGDGFVFERCEIEELAKIHAGSGINRAFARERENDFADNSWLNDRNANVCRPDGWGEGHYIATLTMDGRQYGVRHYFGADIFYLTHTVDKTYKGIYNLNMDGAPDMRALRTTPLVQRLKKALLEGRLRIQDPGCHAVMMSFLK